MEFLAGQLVTFLAMMGFGILLGFLYDIYVRITGSLSRKSIAGLMDILIGVLGGAAGFIVLFYANRGVFRFYIVVAISLGTFCYFRYIKLLSRGK